MAAGARWSVRPRRIEAKTGGDEEAPYQRTPRSADLQKIARIESGVRQKIFGSCDLIMEGETGDAKCLTPSTLAPLVAGLFLVRKGGLGKAVTELERKYLVETDRHIAECKEYIAKQRELIERAIQLGRSPEVAEATLEALEASLRAFERQRRLLLDRLKERER